MRALSLLTNSAILLFLQQLVSIWFLYDFFLTRDSLTANTLWKPKHGNDSPFDKIHTLAAKVRDKHCPNGILGEPSFDKVIFLVIDALGSEFVPTIRDGNQINKQSNQKNHSDAMPFLEESIRQKRAMGFVARAASPTVTMPRIKALLSGTIPSFVDLMYNLAAERVQIDDDNILAIAKARNKSLVFYGDDTWLSLFDRKIFTRSKETFSFFASDYMSVDSNVTELAIPETQLNPIDWDFLILHYLGLDHIGHVFGSNQNPLIRDKLIEMDSVIKVIQENMTKTVHKALLIVCGDHGMSEEGNHGGDTKLEADTAMVFLPINQNFINLAGSARHQGPLRQIDLAVTLSLLTGMPIPKMSKGVAIEQLLGALWSDKDSKLGCAALENVIQLINLTDPTEFDSYPESKELIGLLSRHSQLNNDFSKESHKYLDISRKIQDELLRTIASKSDPILIVIALILVTLLSIFNLRKSSIRLFMPIVAKNERLLCLIIFAIPILMHGSTDFIESEHVFWLVFSPIAFILFSIISINSQRSVPKDLDTLRVALLIITYTVITFWNNFKLFRDATAMADYVIPIISLAILSNSLKQNSDVKTSKQGIVILIGIMLFLSKHLEESPSYVNMEYVSYRALLQQVTMIVIASYTAINVASSTGRESHGSSLLICKLASGWISLAFLLARGYNFFFLIANVVMEASLNSIINSLKLSPIATILIYMSFAQNAFYTQGNSNLFSSIDIKPAFFGQTEYTIYLSVPLVAMATFSTQIYWYMKLFQRLQSLKMPEDQDSRGGERMLFDSSVSFKAVYDFVVTRNFLSLAYYMFVCLVLRNHLFIWSVISPKLVYHFTSNTVLLLTSLALSAIHGVRSDGVRWIVGVTKFSKE